MQLVENLPDNLAELLAEIKKLKLGKILSIIRNVKKCVAIIKAIAEYATPEEKEQLENIYANVLKRAIKKA